MSAIAPGPPSSPPPTKPRLQTTPPNTRPPWRARYGDVVFRATCRILDASDTEKARVVGYDRCVSIAARTELACQVHKGNGKCTPAEVVMLPAGHMHSDGEIFLICGDSTSRIA